MIFNITFHFILFTLFSPVKMSTDISPVRLD